MTKTSALAVLTFLTVSTFAVRGSADHVVEIRLRGHYFSAPATVIVNVAIAPDEQNHRLFIEAESDTFFRSSMLELEGKDDKRIHTVHFKNLPEGAYVLRAEVRSRTEVRGQARQELTVTGVGGR